MSSPSTYVLEQPRAGPRMFEERTAAINAAYLLPHLQPTHKLLDVGCGPGSITCDFGKLVHTVVGLDQSVEDINRATARASPLNLPNVSFIVGNAAQLPFPDDSFDVVHAHQVICHIPVELRNKVLNEMQRVTKPGGLIAFRDVIMDSFLIYPHHLQDSFRTMGRMMTARGQDPNAGQKTHVWAREAGLKVVQHTVSAESIDGERGRSLSRDFMVDVAGRAVAAGVMTAQDWERDRKLWDEYVMDEDGWAKAMSGEVLCRK